jgi:hypothetical protein
MVQGQAFTVTQFADTASPSVNLTTPPNGSTVSNTVAVNANAVDNSGGAGVARVEIYMRNGTLLGTASSYPYTVNWDTTTQSNGTRYMYAKAYDAAGNIAISPTNSVTVANGTVSTLPPSGQLLWTKTTLNGSASATGIKADHSGNMVVVGKFWGAVDFGGQTLTSVNGYNDIFVAKYNSQGTLVWLKSLGNSYEDVANAVTIDSQDNIIVAGYFSMTVDFSGTGASGASLTSSGNYTDMFVAKYSSTGAYIWAHRFGGAFYDMANKVAVDSNGNILLTGQFQSSGDFGTYTLTSGGSYDVAVVKLSAQGAVVWAKQWGGTGSDFPYGLAVDGTGDVAITGSTTTPANFGGGFIGNGGMFMAKYSGVDGSYKWARSSGGAVGYGIAADPTTGNVIVTGGFSGSVDFGGGAITTRDNGGIFIAGYDAFGNYLWTKAYGQSGDAGYAADVDGSGHLAIATGNSGGIDFQGLGLYASGYFLINFTVSGNSAPVFQWAVNGNVGSGTAVAYDLFGHVSVTSNQGSAWFTSQYTK